MGRAWDLGRGDLDRFSRSSLRKASHPAIPASQALTARTSQGRLPRAR